MNIWQKRIEPMIRWVIQGGVREFHDLESQRKIAMTHIISWIGICTLVPLGFRAFQDGNSTLGIFDLSAAVLLLFTQGYSRRTGRFTFTHYFGITSIALLYFFLVTTGGVQETGHLWLFTFPLFASFLLGYRQGAIFSLALFGSVLATWALIPYISVFHPYSFPFQIRFAASFLVVFLFAYSFEKIRFQVEEKLKINNLELARQVTLLKEAEEALQENQRELEKRVEERTQDLNKAREILEEKVQERTASLEKANEELLTEIGERRRAEVQLREAKALTELASRAKSEFLANMSHELRTPLNAIIGFSEILLDRHLGELNQEQAEYIGDIATSGQHLLSLINDILDLSKIESGKMELALAPVSLDTVLQRGLTIVKEKATKHRIQLSCTTDGAPQTILADERKIKQIIFNLLGNAVKFTPDGGRVSIGVRTLSPEAALTVGKWGIGMHPGDESCRAESFLLLHVADTGIGIKTKDLERIFQPFEQGDNSSTKFYQGTGLGLTLSRSFAEVHGGKVWAESEGLGKGSTFYFLFPLWTPDAALPSG